MEIVASCAGVDPDDIQAQVDMMYEHILSSVDVSMNKSFDSTFAGKSERRRGRGRMCPLESGESGSASVKGKAAGEMCVCSCADDTLDVSDSTPSATLLSDGSRACSCCCHRDSHGGSRERGQYGRCVNGVDTSKRNGMDASLSLMSTERIAGHGDSDRLLNRSKFGLLPLRRQQPPPSTFGSGRKGMSDPIKKTADPGPGSYFAVEDEKVLPLSNVRSYSNGNNVSRSRHVNIKSVKSPPVAAASSSTFAAGGIERNAHDTTAARCSKAEKAVKALRRQFELFCDCYWKEFPDLEMPINAAAHATKCPCQSIRAASLGTSDVESRSTSGGGSCGGGSSGRGRVNKKRQQQQRRQKLIIPATSTIAAVSPRREGTLSRKRGAIFGTSPRRTIFSDEPQRGVMAAEKRESGRGREAKKRNSSMRDKTPTRRQAMDEATVPSPGACNVASAFDAVSARGKVRSMSIGRAERQMHTSTFAPGPGAHGIEPKGGGGITGDSAGAAAATRKCFLTSSPRRLELVENKEGRSGPGPGEYSTEKSARSDARHKNAPAFSFGRAKLPGCVKTLFNASTMEKSDESPGPGTYDISTTLPDGGATIGGRSAVITTARRSDNICHGVHYPSDDTPGPGTYTVTDKEKGPSYSLRPRLSERIEVTPGPGHYVLPEKTTGPQWTFSARWRPSVVEEFGPGPGDYFVPIFDLRREHSTAPFFPTAPRRLHEEVSEAATIPGPGAYDMTAGIIDATTRSAVIGTAHRLPAFESSKDDVPGPASYSVRHSSHERHVPVPLLSSTAPRFGDTHENNNHNIMGPTPGPGYYDIDGHMNMVNQRGVVIGTAPRPSIIDETVSAAGVGPGSYYVNQPNDGPSFSMGQRWTKRMTADEEETPGPGMYEPNKLTEGPSAIVSGAPRFKSNDEEKARLNVPGPGAYEAVLPTTKSMTAFFGTSPRMLSKEDDNNNNEKNGLGPGVYDPQEIKSGIAGAAWGKGHRFVVEGQKEEIPGPGWYLPQYVHERHAPAAVFGSSPKHVLAAEEREAFMNKNIGPGSYEVTWQNPHTFHATFGKAETRRIELEGETEKTPGPGHYMIADVPASPSRAVVFGAASRMPLTQQERDKTPGPGAYSPTLQSGGDASPSGPVSFPTAPRFNAAAAADDAAGGYYNAHDGTPGPGAYAVDSEGRYGRAAAVVFGTESRIPNHEEREQALFPGPGQYEITNKWTGMNAPAYTFGKNSRMVGNEGDSIAGGGGGGTGKEGGMPGPGAYDVVIPTFTAPATRFGTAGRTVGPLILAETPGPGTYDVTTGASMTASAPPAYRFSTAPRELHDVVEDTPGPGQYDGTSTNENLQRRFAATAGPSFTTEPRFSAEKDNNDALPPGPGQYSPHHPQWDATQVYSFPSGRKDLLSDNHYAAAEIPGPGTYDISLNRDPGPTFSMYRTAPRGPTLVELEKSQIPGPGAYTIPPAFPVTEGAGAAISFVKAERFKNPGDDTNDHHAAGGSCSVVPGPGYYDPHLPQSTPGPVIGRAPRLAEVDGMVTSGGATVPGPGHYEVARGDSVLSTTIDGGVAMRFTAPRFSTIDEANASEIPGPTSYCPVIPENFASGGISFPHAQRFALAGDSNESAGHPGPGEYSIPSAWHHSAEQAAGYSFGTSRRMEPGDTRQDIPGPGSYDTSQYEKLYMTGPAFSLQGKPSFVQEQAAGAENPGPGAYSLQYMETIGTTARATKFAPLPTVDPDAVFEARINATPGPTTYFIPATLSQQAASFGTAPRTKEETDDHLPGPGAYLTSGPIVVMNQPAFTIGNALRPEIAPHGQSDFPGPGEYHHAMDPRPSVPTFTFAGAERFAEVDAVSNLGPGQYYHPGSADASRGHSFSFPTNPTAATGASATSGSGFLGPGEYFRPVPLGMAERGPTFPTTLGHYPPTLGADTPGPGAYHMEPLVHNTSAAAAARMAAQQRESKTK